MLNITLLFNKDVHQISSQKDTEKENYGYYSKYIYLIFHVFTPKIS